jgi:hypothetical protein
VPKAPGEATWHEEQAPGVARLGGEADLLGPHGRQGPLDVAQVHPGFEEEVGQAQGQRERARGLSAPAREGGGQSQARGAVAEGQHEGVGCLGHIFSAQELGGARGVEGFEARAQRRALLAAARAEGQLNLPLAAIASALPVFG